MANDKAPKPSLDLLAEAVLQKRNTERVGPSTFVLYNAHDGSCASLNSYSLFVCPYDKLGLLGRGLAEDIVAKGHAINLETLLAQVLGATPNEAIQQP